MTLFDLAETDRLLTTTRSVRKRLDLERPVEPEVVLDCVRLSQQAPTGGNQQGWRWLFVTDQVKKDALGELYRRGGAEYLRMRRDALTGDERMERVLDSAAYLAEILEQVPVLAIPCLKGRLPADAPLVFSASTYGSIFPAVWSFQLALRSRGLGSCITSFHLAFEDEAAALLDIPADVMQVALLPVAYTKGTEFKPADRPDPARIVRWDSWENRGS